MWDTAGSETFKSVTSHYYRGALGVILVFDITCLESFCNLEYWLEQVRDVCSEDCRIALMANKVDIMFGEPEKREVLREQAVLFARDHCLLYVDECSAKHGINVDETFMAVAEGIRETQMQLVEEGRVPLASLTLKEADTALHF